MEYSIDHNCIKIPFSNVKYAEGVLRSSFVTMFSDINQHPLRELNSPPLPIRFNSYQRSHQSSRGHKLVSLWRIELHFSVWKTDELPMFYRDKQDTVFAALRRERFFSCAYLKSWILNTIPQSNVVVKLNFVVECFFVGHGGIVWQNSRRNFPFFHPLQQIDSCFFEGSEYDFTAKPFSERFTSFLARKNYKPDHRPIIILFSELGNQESFDDFIFLGSGGNIENVNDVVIIKKASVTLLRLRTPWNSIDSMIEPSFKIVATCEYPPLWKVKNYITQLTLTFIQCNFHMYKYNRIIF